MPASDASIPPEVARQAMNPSACGPEPEPDSGARRIVTPSYCLLLTSMPSLTFVEDLAVEAVDAPAVVAEVRGHLRAAGRTQAAWCVPLDRADLLAALEAEGMTPYVDPPLGEQFASMALVKPPAGSAGPGVEVREVVALEDFMAFADLAGRSFEMREEDREGYRAALRFRYEQEQRSRSPMRTYLAYVDGEVAGEAQAMELDAGTNLSGGSVVPEMRGRGVYRALVAARWEATVRRGRPALTVQAGPMSEPILRRLGFVTVAVQAVLCDTLG
jgi:predicted GNAT family acetyltransferase